MTEHAVVIAGGGPTGLMLAGELAFVYLIARWHGFNGASPVFRTGRLLSQLLRVPATL